MACGAAGVADDGEVVGILTEVADFFCFQTGKVCEGRCALSVEEGEVADVDGVGECLLETCVADHEHGVGVVVDVAYLFHAEVAQDGYEYGSVGKDAEC